jgi:NADH-ubiquinone oxidoreductase chain 5
MMVIAVGLSQFNIALAHLVLHAMYKAGLFLAAGSVLHALGDQQDFRRFGGLVKILPVTYTVMLIASLSLAALPWLSGYYSKDLIIELAYGSYTSLGYLVYLLATIAACFTMLYSVKLLYLTFLTYANAPKGNYEKAHESPWVMTLPLIILGILSVYLGNITRDYFMGLGSQGFGNSIYTHPNHIILIDTEFGVPTLNKLLPLILSMLFAILALYLFEKKPLWLLTFNTSNIGQNIYRFFNQRYWFELIYNRCIVKGTLYIGYVTNTILDRGAFELIGPRGAVAGLYKISNYFASFDSGSIARYAFVMFSGLLFMLFTWIMFANPESIVVDSYSSNYSHGISLSIYQSNYIILIGMSYLNCINNIIYYLLNWKNNPDQYNIPNPYILLSGRSDVPSGSGNPSGFGQGGFNSNTGGSNGGGDDDNNNNKKRKHEEGDGDQEMGISKDKGKGKAVDDANDHNDNFIPSKDKGKGKAVDDGNDYNDNIMSNDDYWNAIREKEDREYALALQRSLDEHHRRNTGESTSRDNQVEQDVASFKDKGKGKAVDQDYGTNYDDNKRWEGSSSNSDLYQPSTSKSIGNNNWNPYHPSSSKTIEKKDPDTYQPSSSKSIEKKDPVPDPNYPPSDDGDWVYDDRPSPTPSEADRYLQYVDDKNIAIAIQKSLEEEEKRQKSINNTSSNDIDKKEESIPNPNNGERSSSNSNSKDENELSSNSNTKNNGDNVSKEVSESITKSESDNKLDIIPKSSSPSSNEENPVKKILEDKIINFDKNSKGSSETWFDDSWLKIIFENPIVDSLMYFVKNRPEDMLLEIVNIISSIFG